MSLDIQPTFAGQKVLIIGAGLAGTLMAILLAQRGARVEVIERQVFQPDQDCSNKRSFNITISSRGVAGFKAAGIWDRVKARTIPITGRMCHEGTVSTPFPYSPDRSEALHGARRADVNAELLAAASEYDAITIRDGWMLLSIDKEAKTTTIAPVSDEGAAETIADADIVIGADGFYSTMRRLIHRGTRADFAKRYLDWNYREVVIPAGPDPARPWRLDPHSLHIWPRGDLMMFALPNPDGSFTGNFIYPVDKDDDFLVPGRMGDLFRREFPDVAAMVPDAEDRLRETPASYFPTQRNSKWYDGETFVMIGDAAHATVPFYGQGMNSAFESVLELIACLEAHGPKARESAFAAYQRNRKPHTDAVADLSIANFEELRSNFRRPLPQARRRLEVLLNRLFPSLFIPLHVKISHMQVGYRTAVDECARRDRVLRWFGFDGLVYGLAGAEILARGVMRSASAAGRIFSRLSSGPGSASGTPGTGIGMAPDGHPGHRA